MNLKQMLNQARITLQELMEECSKPTDYTPLMDLVIEMEQEYRKIDTLKGDLMGEIREDLGRRINR